MRRGVIAHVQILSQLERNADAIALLDRSFAPGSDLEVDDLRRRLAAGEPFPLTIARNATDGIAEVFFTMAAALNGQAGRRLYHDLRPRRGPSAPRSHRGHSVDRRPVGTTRPARSGHRDLCHGRPDRSRFSLCRNWPRRCHLCRRGKEAALEMLQELARSHGRFCRCRLPWATGCAARSGLPRRSRPMTPRLPCCPNPGRNIGRCFSAAGICPRTAGNFDAAETDLRRALELEPESAAGVELSGLYALSIGA